MLESAVGRLKAETPTFWRAATLGIPLWTVSIVIGFFAAAPLVDAVTPAATVGYVIEIITVACLFIVGCAMATVLFRSSSDTRRGLGLALVTASVVALVFASVHAAVNAGAVWGVAP